MPNDRRLSAYGRWPSLTRRTLLFSSLAACAGGRIARLSAADAQQHAATGSLLSTGFSYAFDHVDLVNETTFAVCLPLEADARAARFAFVNTSSKPVTILAALATSSISHSDFVNPADNGRWIEVSFSDVGLPRPNIIEHSSARRFQIPPAPSCLADKCTPTPPHLWWSDFVPLDTPEENNDSIRFVMIRVLMDANQTITGLANAGGWTNKEIPYGRDVGFSFVKGDFVDSPNPISMPYETSFSPVVCMQYISRTPGLSVICGGDSHFADPVGFAIQACWALSSPGRPMTCWNLAMAGMPSDVFWPLLDENVRAHKPSIVLLQGWTANDPQIGSAQTTERYLARLDETASSTRKYGGIPIYVTPFPRGTDTLHGDNFVQWKRSRDVLLSRRESGSIVFDATPVLGQLNNGQYNGDYLSGYSNDGIHANATGQRALATALKDFLTKLL